MSRMLCCVLTVGLALLAAAPAAAGDFHAGLNAGYTGGLGVHATGAFENFTRDVPLSARLTLGYNAAGAGDPYAARRIFINDNTNGTPEKSASTWQFRFDLMFPVFAVGGHQVHLFAGPRHARYTANFNYVGGNENFDVTSNPWGAGVGLETRFVMGERTDFVVQAGGDWYADARLQGHDTAYLPGGDHVNPRDDYGYGDADDAVEQPQLELLATIGVRLRF